MISLSISNALVLEHKKRVHPTNGSLSISKGRCPDGNKLLATKVSMEE
jgi:hypothetical protein